MFGVAVAQAPSDAPPAQQRAQPAPAQERALADAPEPEQPPAAALFAGPQPIRPVNALENAFVAALTNPDMRPVFRRLFLDSQVALALETTGGDEARVRTVPIQNNVRAAAIFTTPERLRAILGDDAPFATLSGRDALARVRANNAAINFMWAPMLTLEPDDIANWLDTPETPANVPAARQQ
jgi:hypothetical protein